MPPSPWPRRPLALLARSRSEEGSCSGPPNDTLAIEVNPIGNTRCPASAAQHQCRKAHLERIRGQGRASSGWMIIRINSLSVGIQPVQVHAISTPMQVGLEVVKDERLRQGRRIQLAPNGA